MSKSEKKKNNASNTSFTYIDFKSMLKHKKKAKFYFDENIKDEYMYYSCTKHSYPQRSNKLDNSLIASTELNAYIKYYILKLFKIKECCFKSDGDWIRPKLEELINNKSNFIYLNCRSRSYYFVMVDSIRNCFAHGTYNIIGNKMLFINQSESKENAKIVFAMMCDCNGIKEKLRIFIDAFSNISFDKKNIKYVCLSGDNRNCKKYDGKPFCACNMNVLFFDKIKPKQIISYNLIKQIFEKNNKYRNLTIVINKETSNRLKENNYDKLTGNKILSEEEFISIFDKEIL